MQRVGLAWLGMLVVAYFLFWCFLVHPGGSQVDAKLVYLPKSDEVGTIRNTERERSNLEYVEGPDGGGDTQSIFPWVGKARPR